MPEFTLTPEQIGEIVAGEVRHPEKDIFGSAYERVNATRKYFKRGDKRFFVVIPNGKDSDENTYVLPGDSAVPAATPVVAPAEKNILAEALKSREKE